MTDELTEAGRVWAEGNRGTSIVARVALSGITSSDWPETHTALATRVCNEEGRKADQVTQIGLIKEAEAAKNLALQNEQRAVELYARAYSESIERSEEGSIVLLATPDGWNDGPLPYALEITSGANDGCDPDAVFLFRDGGPTCPHFWMEEAQQAIEDGRTPELGALAFVRQITDNEGNVAFRDGQQVAGLLLVALGDEGR